MTSRPVACGQGDCTVEIVRATDEEAQRDILAHRRARHPEYAAAETTPLPRPEHPVPQLAHVQWRTDALEALRRLAAEVDEFVIFDVDRYGVGQPLRPKTDWGHLARDAKQLGIIAHALNGDGSEKAVRSKRPATRGSLVSVWTAGAAVARRRLEGRLA